MKKISIAVFSVILLVISFLYKNFAFKNESKIIEKDSGQRFLVEYDPMTEDVVETLIEESNSKVNKHKNSSYGRDSRNHVNTINVALNESLSKFDRDQTSISEEDDIDKRLEEVIKAREKKEKEKEREKDRKREKDNKTEKDNKIYKENGLSTKIDMVVRFARSKLGKPYRRAGVTDKGYDCSGLIMSSFSKYNFRLPRASFQMAKKGQSISVKNIQKGDLLFFGLNKLKPKSINHVAIVTKVKVGIVYFVHSKERSGVIENTLKEGYYRKRLLKVRRYIK